MARQKHLMKGINDFPIEETEAYKLTYLNGEKKIFENAEEALEEAIIDNLAELLKINKTDAKNIILLRKKIKSLFVYLT